MRTGVLAMTPETKRQSSGCVGETFLRLKKIKFQRYRITNMFIHFFESQIIMQKKNRNWGGGGGVKA
jgi:hypothetical protein